AVDARPVHAFEVAHAPPADGVRNLRVLPAAQVVLEDDAVGVGPAQAVALADVQGQHVPEAVVTAKDQICVGATEHYCPMRVRGVEGGTSFLYDIAFGLVRAGKLKIPKQRAEGKAPEEILWRCW